MRIILLLALLFFFNSCTSQTSKINGVSFVAARDAVNEEQVRPVVDLQANHAAVMPFGFIRNLETPEIVHNTERQWYGETRAGAKQYIEELRKHGIKVMIKPQIWIWRGEFTGYLKMNNESDWQKLEQSYTDFIMEYANLAAEVKAELFCIGTELEQFVVNRPEYWQKLITQIKSVYNGKLTYAANWDEYKRVPFWKQLDFIGVDAYFPISESKTPSVAESREGWNRWKDELFNVSRTHNRRILFTEYGYRSMDFSGKEPWNSSRNEQQVNLEAQANLLTALYEGIWNEPWFAGGYIWKWFINHDRVGGVHDDQFTPQNKPASMVVQYYYSSAE